MQRVLALKVRCPRPIRVAALLAALWLGGELGGAALQPAPVSGGLYDTWQIEEVDQQNTVTAIVQTRDGYLWLGTYHGLLRFDGVRFTVYDSGNTRGLQNGLITSLYEDQDGVLWIGHETGQVTRLVDRRFQPVDLGRTAPSGHVEAITADDQGDVWLLDDSGTLFRVRDGHVAQAPGGASPTHKAALARAANGKLWIVCNGQIATLEGGEIKPFQFPDAQSTDFYERILPARDGGLWVLANERLRKWHNGQWTDQMSPVPGGPGAATLLMETRGGVLLAGTLREGLYLLAPGVEPLHFSRTNGLSQDWVRAVCEDREGNLWVGTGAGFDSLRPRKVRMLNPPDGWQGCAVLSFSAHADGSAWIGTEGAGLYYYEHGRWSSFTQDSGVANLFIWSVLETKAGQLFVGSFGGGLLLRTGDRFESPGELANITAPVLSLYAGRRGELWIGTTTGLQRYEDGKVTCVADKDQLVLPDVRAITEAGDGTLWFGMSGGGLGSLREGVLKQYRKQDGLGSDFVISLYADRDGTLWIGTSDSGLTRLRQGRFATIGAAQGLPSGVIAHMVDDGEGHLWLGTHHGILRASKADLNRCADGAVGSVHCLSYGKAEGLASLVCSGGFTPGATRTPDGRLWFPTAKGLAIVDPANVSTNAVPPPVVIEDLLVDGQPFDLPPADPLATMPTDHGRPAETDPLPLARRSSLRIPPGHQRFELRYTGLSFTAPDKVHFRYKLDGLEPDWEDAGAKRVVQYSYLRPGTYAFHVTACNNDEVWNDTGATLEFTVLPYFYQTWWFEAALVAGGAGMVGAGVLSVSRRRVQRKLEQLERQRALERERARIARDIHDDLGASLTRITLLSQSVRSELSGQPQAAADLDQIYGTARELTRAMDEIVWAVNPKHDTLDSLVTYLGRFAQNFLSAAAIRCRLDVPVNLPPWALTAEIRHNVFLAFKEALHNVVQHAGATEVRIAFEMLPRGFLLLIADNGRGFDLHEVNDRSVSADGARLASGNGLLNMQKRLEEVGGACEWNTAPGEGARVKLTIVVER